MAAGDTGWLFVNGTHVAELDLGGLADSGELRLLGAWFGDDETAGGVTPLPGLLRPAAGQGVRPHRRLDPTR